MSTFAKGNNLYNQSPPASVISPGTFWKFAFCFSSASPHDDATFRILRMYPARDTSLCALIDPDDPALLTEAALGAIRRSFECLLCPEDGAPEAALELAVERTLFCDRCDRTLCRPETEGTPSLRARLLLASSDAPSRGRRPLILLFTCTSQRSKGTGGGARDCDYAGRRCSSPSLRRRVVKKTPRKTPASGCLPSAPDRHGHKINFWFF